MNLGLDNIRELIEGFLQNTGGRRGREREKLRQGAAGEGQVGVGQGPGAQPADGGAAQASTGQGDGGVAQAGATVGAGGPTAADGPGGQAGQGPTTGRERPDPDELDEDEVVDDLYQRIETLEDELERNGSKLGSVRDAQKQVVDEVQDVNDTIRQLLGVYDRLTSDVNPFTGEGEGDAGFGVFGEDGPEEGFGIEASASTDAAEETVSFDDLKAVIEEAAEEESAGAQKITFDEDDIDEDEGDEVDSDTHVEVQATESVDGSPGEVDEAGGAGSNDGSDGDESDDVTLQNLASTYASDIIVFEWLTDMVRTAGPSATLRAISYYHEIGWIEADVKEHLEAVLSGPDLDIHVDPGATPEELTAEDHADSYTYIMKLSEIHEARKEVDA